MTRQQRFEWHAYCRAWHLERVGRNEDPTDPAGEYDDPVLVKAARLLWARRSTAPSLDPGDYSWAKPQDRARFEAQDRERALFRSMFLSNATDAVNADGTPSQAALDYVALCMGQARENIAHMTGPQLRSSEDDLAAIRTELGIGPGKAAA